MPSFPTPSPDPASLAMMGGGSILDAVGGFIGAQQGRTDAHQARDLWMRNAQNQSLGLGRLLYGNQFNLANDRPGTDSWKGQYYQGGGPAAPGSLLGRLAGLGDWAQGQGNSMLGMYNADTSRLANLSGGAEAMARNWGQGRAGVINSDMDKALREANRSGDAALAAGGFNSPTTRAGQYAGNQASIGRERQRALQDASDSQIDRQLGARTQTLNVAGSRASGQTGLMSNLLGQQIGLKQIPMNLEYGAATSGQANPWIGQGPTSTYVPSPSPMGNLLGGVGSGMAGYGSFQLGQQSQADLIRLLGGQYGGQRQAA